MISAKFLWGYVFLGAKQQIDAKKFKFWNFWESSLYEVSEYAFNQFITHFPSNVPSLLSLTTLTHLFYNPNKLINFFTLIRVETGDTRTKHLDTMMKTRWMGNNVNSTCWFAIEGRKRQVNNIILRKAIIECISYKCFLLIKY